MRGGGYRMKVIMEILNPDSKKIEYAIQQAEKIEDDHPERLVEMVIKFH